MLRFSHKIVMIFYGCNILHRSAPMFLRVKTYQADTLNSSVNNFLERLICIAE